MIGFLRQVRGWAKLVGICFGHQAMAEAFGGTVVKWEEGWSIGLHLYQVQGRAAWMENATGGDKPHLDMPASHQDQVLVCPPGARVTIASAFTRHAGLDYGDAISFQFHPEYEAAFSTALIEARQDCYGALADPAIQSYARPHDCTQVRQWIGRFLDTPS